MAQPPMDISKAPLVPMSKIPGYTLGGVTVQSEADLQSSERYAEAAQQAADAFQCELSAEIQRRWQDAKTTRSLVELDMMKDFRQRNEEYEPDIKAKLAESGGSDLYDNITEKLSAAGIAWIQDLILHQPDEKPWSIEPTPVPTLPADVMAQLEQQVATEAQQFEQGGINVSPAQIEEFRSQLQDFMLSKVKEEAKRRSEGMSAKIEDIIAESGFEDAFKEFLDDFVSMKIGCLELVTVRVKEPKFKQINGVTVSEMADVEKKRVERFSPFDAYWSNDAVTPQDGFFFRRFWPSRKDIAAMKGMSPDSGYNDVAIEWVLNHWQDGKGSNTAATDGERARIEGKQNTLNPHGSSMEALKFWGSVRGEMLNRWNRPPKTDEPTDAPVVEAYEDNKDYEISAIWINGRCIKAKIHEGRRTVYVSSWRKKPGSFLGKGVATLIRTNQSACNSIRRAKMNNLGFASLPIYGIDQSKLPPGVSITKLFPGMVIPFENRDGQTSKVIEIWVSPLLIEPLESALQVEYRRAEDIAGIPPYQYGQQETAGAGRTASGLQMLLNSSSRGIKMSIGNIDQDIMKPLIRDIWTDIMLFDPDESIKGDVSIKAKGAMALFIKESVTLRRIDLMNATQGPIDTQIKGITGRAAELREAYKAVHIDPDSIIPSDGELRAKQAAQEAAQVAAVAGQGAPQPGQRPPQQPGQPPIEEMEQ